MRAPRSPYGSRLSCRALRLEDLECRRLLSVSTIGDEQPIGEITSSGNPGTPIYKDIATNSAGDFTVVWQRRGEQDFDIFARRYDANGDPLGDEFQVNSYSSGDQVRPAIATNDAGQVVIAWESWQAGGWSTIASFYDADGNLLSGDVLVSPMTSAAVSSPDVAISEAGRVLFAYGTDTTLRFFDASGNAEGDEFRELFAVSDTRVAFDGNGGYVIAGFQNTSFVWRRYAADDAPLTHSNNVLSLPSERPSFDFDMNSAGEIIAASFDHDHIYIQRVASTDVPLGLPITVPVAGYLPLFDLHLDDAGNFAVGTANVNWDGPQSWSAIYYFDADNTLNDVLTFADSGNVELQAPAIAFTGVGQGIVILNRKPPLPATNSILTFQHFSTDSLTISGVLSSGIDFIHDDMMVPFAVRDLEVRLSRAASVKGGAAGIHSVLNPANWQLWRGNENISGQISAIEYSDGRVTITLANSLPSGNYRLLASDAIQDTSGNAFDGNGDGLPGDAAERRFTVGPVRPVGELITTADARSTVAVAANSSGQFAIVSLRGTRFRAQFFDASGQALTGELPLNTIDGSDLLMKPKVFFDDSGDLHIFWSRNSTGAGWWATYNTNGVVTRPIVALPNKTYDVALASDGRAAAISLAGLTLYSAQGIPTVPTITPQTLGVDGLDSVAFTGDAQLLLGGGLNNEIMVLRLSDSGQPIGAPVPIDSSFSVLSRLTLVANPIGGFAVGWQSYSNDPSDSSLIRRQANVRLFAADGSPLGDQIIVASEEAYTNLTQNPAWAPGIAFDGSGRFVVTWQNFGIDGDQLGVAARGYLPDGTPLGPAFRVSTPVLGNQQSPTIAANSDGGVALGWLSAQFLRVQFFELTDLPTVDLNGASPGLSFADDFAPNQFSQPLTANLTINDAGFTQLYGAFVQIRSTVPGDQLLVDTTGTTLHAAFEMGTLTITGEADRATYEQVLRTVRFVPAVSRTTGELIEVDISVDLGVIRGAVSTAALSLYLPGSAAIVNRSLFYNNSAFDHSNKINSWDELARATDKLAYLPGSGHSTFANISSYSRGINGLMIDLSPNHGDLSLDDFVFRAGNSNSPETWETAPAPNGFVITALNESTHRITFTWSDGAIRNTWLEVTMLANPNTGLAADDVFYFGSRVGDAGLGNSPAAAITNIADQLAVRANPTAGVGIESVLDFNRDGLVNIGDELAGRANPGFLLMLNLPAPAMAMTAAPLNVAVGAKDSNPATGAHADLGAVASALSLQRLVASPAAAPAVSTAEPLVTRAPSVRTLDAVALAVTLVDEPDGFAADATEEADEDHGALLDELLAP